MEKMSNKENIDTENNVENSAAKKSGWKGLLAVIIILLAITTGAAIWYNRSLNKTPEHSLVVVTGGEEKVVDIDKLDLVSFSGTAVNGKGEQKDIETEGIRLEDVIDSSDYSEVTVTSDDAYTVDVKKEEMGEAWLEIEEGSARLYVFSDTNSKRNVKNVVRIEVK